MKCILHVGTEKTGTTTLQKFLDINRELLLHQNIIYTRSAGLGNNRNLVISSYDLARRDDYTKLLDITEDSQLEKFGEKTFNRIKNEIKQKIKKTKGPTVIFSSEHFHSRLRKEEDLLRLKSILNKLGFRDIRVLIYLRDPASVASSLFSTALKAGSILDRPPAPTEVYFNNICNHKESIIRFQKIFGEDKINIRIFEKDFLVNSSIIHDFASVVGFTIGTKLKIPTSTNKSLSPVGVYAVQRINNQLPMFTFHKLNHKRLKLNKFIEDHLTNGQYRMPEKLYMEYDNYFKESNEWVRKQFFPERDSLFPLKNYRSNYIDGKREDLNDVIDFALKLWAVNYKVSSIGGLNKYLKGIKRKLKSFLAFK